MATRDEVVAEASRLAGEALRGTVGEPVALTPAVREDLARALREGLMGAAETPCEVEVLANVDVAQGAATIRVTGPAWLFAGVGGDSAEG